MLSSGQLLAERYRLTSRIAVGGMGEVWQANDTRLDRTVAVKILKAELSGDAEFLHRFRAEARTTASLNHPGIAAVHDYGEASSGIPAPGDKPESLAYLVMELVDGEPLAGILARDGRVPAERLLPILEQAGRALNAAHEQGLVHRDIKPGNILVARSDDGSDLVKLTDFGIAKAGESAPVTRNGMVMGTAHYIAPEQATGHDASPASDVYSLAVCGYECLSGHRPFLSENAVTVAMMHIRDAPPPLPADVPPTVRALIESTLVKDPARRYATGGEFAAAVAAVRAGHPPPPPVGVTATPPGGVAAPPGPPSQPTMVPVAPAAAYPQAVDSGRGRSGWLWGVVAVLAVALVATADVLLVVMNSDGSEDDSDQTPDMPETTQHDPQQPAPQDPERPDTQNEGELDDPTVEQPPPQEQPQQPAPEPGDDQGPIEDQVPGEDTDQTQPGEPTDDQQQHQPGGFGLGANPGDPGVRPPSGGDATMNGMTPQ